MSTRSGTIPNRRPTETLKTGPAVDAFLPDQPKCRRQEADVFAAGHLFSLPLSNPFFYLGTLIVLKDLSLIVLLSITGVLQVPRPEEEIANKMPIYKVAFSCHDSYVKIISVICYVMYQNIAYIKIKC